MLPQVVPYRFDILNSELDYVFGSASNFSDWVGINLIFTTSIIHPLLLFLIGELQRQREAPQLPVSLCPWQKMFCPSFKNSLNIEMVIPKNRIDGVRLTFSYNSSYSTELWFLPGKERGQFVNSRLVFDHRDGVLVVAPSSDYHTFMYTWKKSLWIGGYQRALMDDLIKFAGNKLKFVNSLVYNSMPHFYHYIPQLEPKEYKNVSRFRLESTSDFNKLALMPVSTGMAETGLYPMIIHSYAIIYVKGSKNFSIYFNPSLFEFLLLSCFLTILIHKLVAHFILEKMIQRRNWTWDVIFRFISGCLGQETVLRPKWISVGIVAVVFFFLVYITYVFETGLWIAMLSTKPRLKFNSLDAVARHFDVQLYVEYGDTLVDKHLVETIT